MIPNQLVQCRFKLGGSNGLIRLVKGVLEHKIAEERIYLGEQRFHGLGVDTWMSNAVKFEARCRLQTSQSKGVGFDFQDSAVPHWRRRNLAADGVQTVKRGRHAQRVVAAHLRVAREVLREHHRAKPIDDGLKRRERERKKEKKKKKKKKKKIPPSKLSSQSSSGWSS
jgi:hypothetical protein